MSLMNFPSCNRYFLRIFVYMCIMMSSGKFTIALFNLTIVSMAWSMVLVPYNNTITCIEFSLNL